MLTGKALVESLVDNLNELGMPNMAATLEDVYRRPGFLEMDHLTLIAELIGAEYKDKVSKRVNNRHKYAKLTGSPAEIDKCEDTAHREYLPKGLPNVLSTMDFIPKGFNVCILGASDSGKTYLAKAIGIKACESYRVGYFHCAEILEQYISLKKTDFSKYEKKLKGLLNLDLIILDDFLLHTLSEESEIKLLFSILKERMQKQKSTIVCSQRNPESWTAMIMNDEISANAITKRVTKHYTVMIKTK